LTIIDIYAKIKLRKCKHLPARKQKSYHCKNLRFVPIPDWHYICGWQNL
jgi:hypothetical protein